MHAFNQIGISSEKLSVKLFQHFIVSGEAFGGTAVNSLSQAAKNPSENKL